MTDININLPEIPPDSQKFLARIFGPLADIGDLLSDKIRFYRWKSSLKTFSIAQKIAEEHGLPINEIPLRTLVPLIEKSSLEEENSPLIDQWANLLAGAAANCNDSFNSYIDILSRLSKDEVFTLEKFISEKFIGEIFNKDSVVKGDDNKINIQLSVNNDVVYHHFRDKIESIVSNSDKEYYYENLRKWTFEIIDDDERVLIERITTHCVPYNSDNIFILNRKYTSSSVDILFSTGLFTRRVWTFSFGGMETFVYIALPTSLGVKFVMACRGDKFGTEIS